MKRTLFIILVIFMMANGLDGQELTNGLMENYKLKKTIEGTYSRYNLKPSEIQGTPYLNEKFVPGKLITSKGAAYTGVPLRYNGYSDDLEFQKGEDSYNMDPKTIVKRAEFGGLVLVCVQYYEGRKSKDGFFQLLTEGKATLLVKYTVKLLDKESAKPFIEPKPARFDDPKKDYYLSINGAPAVLISNKKSLLELFGAEKDKMESYISGNKLSIKKDDDMIKIVSRYNRL